MGVLPTRRRKAERWLTNRAKDLLLRPLKCPIGAALAVLGLASVPDDVGTWQRWITKLSKDERILALAEQAAEAATWLNQPWVRFLFVVIGVTLLAWRLPGVWRLRHRVLFLGRSVLADSVWIDRPAALNLLKNSRWGQLKRPTTSILDFPRVGVSGMTESQRSMEKFHLFLEMTLDSFEEDNSASVRETGTGSEYEEAALRRFIRHAMRDELEEEFGRVPRGIV